MASPATPPPQRNFGSHRSFTLPIKLASSNRTSSFGSHDSSIETLFESPQCKLVSFTAQPAGRARTASLTVADIAARPVGELPYASKTERTMAIGPLIVYRPPGSVAFLNFGKLVHPVLPKSACWCVDGQSKFVLGVPGNKYYRIELPYEDGDDQSKANDFKVVLATIAQYETTACPFKRGFHVELPELSPITPRRPWKPKHSPGVTSPWSPEGQQMVDGIHIQRRFPSPPRRPSQSPRRPYQMRSVSAEQSDAESISDISRSDVEDTRSQETRVPQMVATLEEFGPMLDAPCYSPSPDLTQQTSVSVDLEPPPALEVVADEPAQDQSEDRTQEAEDVATAKAVEVVQPEQPLAEVPASEPDTTDSELEEVSEPGSSHASPFKKSALPHLHLKDDLESLSWLDDGESHETPTTAKPFLGVRSTTAPVYSPLQAEQTPKAIPITYRALPRHDSDTESLASSVESSSSFHSLHSPTSPEESLPLAFLDTSPVSASSAVLGDVRAHKRDKSDATIKISTTVNAVADLSTPTWPPFSPCDDEDEAGEETEADTDTKSFRTASAAPSPERKSRSTTYSTAIKLRLSRRRTQSPLPPPANLYIPPASLSGHFTNIILQKTCSLLLGPPVQLVALMLNLARKFADGSLNGESYTYGDQGQPIPCEWCDSDLDMHGGNSSEEDDYGISIGGTPEEVNKKQASGRRRILKETRWDID